MKGIIILIIFVLLLFYFCATKENFEDNLYGENDPVSCEQICENQHPEAARMDLDGDNDVADTVMSNCLKECRASRGTPSRRGPPMNRGCSTCG